MTHTTDTDYAKSRVAIVKARKGFLDFVTYTKPDYHVNWHHKLLCDNLNDFLFNPNRSRLMIFAPPRTGKSEIVSRRFPAYCFGHFPDMEIIGASYGADLAQAMNRDLQRVIDSDPYRKLFPETQLSGKNVAKSSLGSYVRTSDKFEIVGRTGQYKSAGVGGALTGSGGSLIIIDDPVKDMKEAMSSTVQRATWDWYTSVAATRLAKDGKIIIMLTRWNQSDLAGKLLDRAKQDPDADQWEILCFPMEYEPDHEHLNIRDNRTEEGELLWPEWFPEDKVKSTKATVGSKVWSSLYQQRPAPAGGTILKSSWLNYYKELPEFEYIAASWDFTFKGTDTSDYVAGGVFGVKGSNKYLIYLLREKLSFVETIKAVLRVKAMFPDLRCQIIEDKANGPAVIDALKDKIKGLITYTPTESKEARANAVAPQFEAGNIWLPDQYYEPNREKYPWMCKLLDIYIEEIKHFPYAKNDDMLDMTVQFLLKMGKTSGWFEQMVTKDDTILEENIHTQLSNIMGWDLESSNNADTMQEYMDELGR